MICPGDCPEKNMVLTVTCPAICPDLVIGFDQYMTYFSPSLSGLPDGSYCPLCETLAWN